MYNIYIVALEKKLTQMVLQEFIMKLHNKLGV